MADIFFEDLVPGTVTTFGPKRVTREEITAFAREYDAQPFHLSEETARSSFAGRQIASGWHTVVIQMRMLCDAWLLQAAGLGSPGIDSVEWLKPVLPGDELTVRQTITGAKASRSRPGIGLVQFGFETQNGAGETVMRQQNPIMFRLRNAPATEGATRGEFAAAPAAPAGDASGFESLRPPTGGGSQMIRGFDELEVGATDFLGEHTFTAEDIIRFATAFDPQPFHVSEEAGRNSPFGRLAASGWHTAALWMRHLVRARREAIEAAEASGLGVPRFGTSPGFKALRWLKPVYAGDTIRYATTVVDKRPSRSRPGWGLSFSHNTGWNQHGDKIFEFTGSGFIGEKDAADAAHEVSGAPSQASAKSSRESATPLST